MRTRSRHVEPDPQWDSFRVSPRCPPDKTLWMRGGLIYWYFTVSGELESNRAWQLPSTTIDFADPASVGIDITFTNSSWYKGYVVAVTMHNDTTVPTFYLYGSGVESETAVEAEQEFVTWQWYAVDHAIICQGYQLCAIILKNDGVVGPGCNILPIDSINRGRSYIFQRDLRPLERVGVE